jgi:hypothetical protein
MAWGRGRETERRSWHGMNQPKPRLPYYFHTSKRLKNLDEFESPSRTGRVRFGDNDQVTLRGVVRETLRFLVVFTVAGVIIVSAWRWLYGSQTCIELIRGFKIGWC